MVGVIEVLILLVAVALLEITLQTCGFQYSTLKAAIKFREVFAIYIIVVVCTIVRHIKVSVVILDYLLLLGVLGLVVNLRPVTLAASVLYSSRV